MVLPTPESAHVANVSLELWYRHLGHAMTRSIEKLSHQSMVTGLDIADDGGDKSKIVNIRVCPFIRDKGDKHKSELCNL